MKYVTVLGTIPKTVSSSTRRTWIEIKCFPRGIDTSVLSSSTRRTWIEIQIWEKVQGVVDVVLHTEDVD